MGEVSSQRASLDQPPVLGAHALSATSSRTIDAASHALGVVNHQLSAHASMLATTDSFTVLACAFLVGVPLTLALKSAKTEKGALAVH